MKLDLIFYLSMIEADDDKVKFEQLYSHYLKLALHRAGEFLPDEQLAEDAVSIAFLKIAQNMHKVDEAVSPRTKL